MNKFSVKCISSPFTCVAITFLQTFLSSHSVVPKFLALHLQNSPETSEQSSVTSRKMTEPPPKMKSVNGRKEAPQDMPFSARGFFFFVSRLPLTFNIPSVLCNIGGTY